MGGELSWSHVSAVSIDAVTVAWRSWIRSNIEIGAALLATSATLILDI
jgi:hypothetical protein